MKQRLIRGLLAGLLWFLPHQSFAQTTEAGITFVGLASIQPIDDAYVGGPYLSEGIGGVAPGFGVGGNVIWSNGVTVAIEYTTAHFEREQGGRLVDGVYGGGGPHTTRLKDSLLSGLAGYVAGTGTTRVMILGGVSAKLDLPTVDGVEREDLESEDENTFPLVFTGGVDVIRALSGRVSLTFGARYSFIDRKVSLQYLGIGRDVLRAGVGIRVRLN
jgi:hypothetical protein